MSRIATWNVRSIRNKENEMIREMERYNIDVLGLSETKARGNGMKVVDGASYVYSGVAEGRAKRGVAIIIAERWADCLKSWRCVSERCVTVRLNVAGVWMTLIQVYAPTDDADSQAKDEFYEEVQDTMNRVPRGDRVIVMGDFNARVGKKILEEQGAFRKKRSCTDQLFTVRMLSQKIIEKNKSMIMVCVDLEKAYDNVIRELMWQVMDEYGIRGSLAKAVKSMYVNCEACVNIKEGNSEWFPVKKGVRQGCVMSPWLFNVYMDRIVREAKERFSGGVKLEESNVQFLLFVDDLILVAEREEDVENNLNILDEVMAKWSMKVNWGKTKALVVKRGGGSCNVSVKGEMVEEVKVMKYLGALFNEEGTCEDEIESRIGATGRTIGALRQEVVDRRELSKTTKLRVYNAIVNPTLLYGSETWTLQKRHMKKLQAVEMRYLRKVEGVTRMDKVRSDDIRMRLRQEDVVATVHRKKKQWLRKMEEMPEERLVKTVYMEEMPGKRPRVRPRKRWEDDL